MDRTVRAHARRPRATQIAAVTTVMTSTSWPLVKRLDSKLAGCFRSAHLRNHAVFQQVALGGRRLCRVEPCAPARHSLLDAVPPAVRPGVLPVALQTLICVDLEPLANLRTRAAPKYLPSSDAQAPTRCPSSNAAADAGPDLQSHSSPVSWRRE